MAEESNIRSSRQSLIDALASSHEVRGIWFNGKKLTLDGYHFFNCRFDNCTLLISSNNFELHNCFLDKSTNVSFGEDVVKVLRLFNRVYPWMDEEYPYFVPKRHEDGTISIS